MAECRHRHVETVYGASVGEVSLNLHGHLLAEKPAGLCICMYQMGGSQALQCPFLTSLTILNAAGIKSQSCSGLKCFHGNAWPGRDSAGPASNAGRTHLV